MRRSEYAGRNGDDDLAKAYREKAVYYNGMLDKISDAVKLPDWALPYTSLRPREKQIVMTFRDEWEIPRGNEGQWVASTASTIWRYFALAAFNPMVFDKRTVSYQYFTGNIGQ